MDHSVLPHPAMHARLRATGGVGVVGAMIDAGRHVLVAMDAERVLWRARRALVWSHATATLRSGATLGAALAL